MRDEKEFLKLMQYPKEWVEWDMLPKVVIENQMKEYKPGDEQSSEHYRNGAFHYWIRGLATEEQLIKLVRLSALDPETIMCKYIREKDIPNCENYTEKVAEIIRNFRKKE